MKSLTRTHQTGLICNIGLLDTWAIGLLRNDSESRLISD